jgi:hypothetical protein
MRPARTASATRTPGQAIDADAALLREMQAERCPRIVASERESAPLRDKKHSAVWPGGERATVIVAARST